MRSKKLGTLLICAGLAMILAAVALLARNWRESNTAGKVSGEVLPLLVEEIRERKDIAIDPLSPKMAAIPVDGHEYVGFISLPTLGLELPVMEDWSEAKLKLSPCRYYGSVRGGDMVMRPQLCAALWPSERVKDRGDRPVHRSGRHSYSLCGGRGSGA